jgi:hypothetical protein
MFLGFFEPDEEEVTPRRDQVPEINYWHVGGIYDILSDSPLCAADCWNCSCRFSESRIEGVCASVA